MMKTNLERSICTVQDAEAFLRELHVNGELYHPEDSAHDVEWSGQEPTDGEKDRLNVLMQEVFNLEQSFDPCTFCVEELKVLGVEGSVESVLVSSSSEACPLCGGFPVEQRRIDLYCCCESYF
jgi:hypothetical protein